MSDIEEDAQPEVVEGEEEEDEHAEQVEGEEEEGEEEAEITEEPQPETEQKPEPVEDKKEENGEKKSILDNTLAFTKQLSTSKMKEMIGLENLTENATTVLKMLTPSVLTGQEAPQQPTIIVSARMKELSTFFNMLILTRCQKIQMTKQENYYRQNMQIY
jgi:chromatin segregation and condensation protein Rec8/ScpA/Scc1 (kleisin family)